MFYPSVGKLIARGQNNAVRPIVTIKDDLYEAETDYSGNFCGAAHLGVIIITAPYVIASVLLDDSEILGLSGFDYDSDLQRILSILKQVKRKV